MTKESYTCLICGSMLPKEELQEFDGQLLCTDCFEDQTVICNDCGERIWTADSINEAGYPLCENCFDRHYIRCENCDRVIDRDDANYLDGDEYPYCQSCYDDRCDDDSVIHDYSYKPDPIFYGDGDGNRFFGVELEIDHAGADSYNAEQLLDVTNRDAEYAYCKHDGSLDNGFEIVTHPLSLSCHQTFMPWSELTDKAVRMGYTSHQAKTCGLHVHVNRDAFGETIESQETVIARILYFFEKHWEELLKFSRRTEYQLQRWAARYGYKDQPSEILDHAKKGCGAGRYTCVNITNYSTIEFHMFRGTLKCSTILATLQMIDVICDVALSFSDEEMKGLSWTSFVAAIDREKYAELVAYLKERRLYVNETCVAGEEI